METITITFGDCAENHVGMEKIGSMHDKGFSYDQLIKIRNTLNDSKYECELIDLNIPETKEQSAVILVIRKGINYFLGEKTYQEMFQEQKDLDWDSKAKMYGRVVNKHARHNLCYSDQARDPDYEKGMGRIIGWDQVPITKCLKDRLEEILESKLVGEGNRYYDSSKCGIGFHGDSERRKVIGCRLGGSMNLCYNWFYKGLPVGKKFELVLNGGDMYIMGEKAVGCDWKKKNIYTLRHAAGCKKYTDLPKKYMETDEKKAAPENSNWELNKKKLIKK